MKMIEEIKHYQKQFVFESYSRIVETFKDYEKITKIKMIKEIYKVYEDHRNIIDICTVRELIFLKMYFDNNDTYKKEEYDWERQTLHSKFILNYHYDGEIEIPEEIYIQVKKAIDNMNLNSAKKKDEINEILVSYCKIQGSTLTYSLIQFGCGILGIDEESLEKHIFFNRVFRYYVLIFARDYEGLGNNISTAVFNDYYYILDELEEQRKIQGKSFSIKINLEDYKSLFYNDFNMNNKIIKTFYKELCKLPFFYHSAISTIKEYALLNLDRESLKSTISSVPVLSNYDLTSFFDIMDKAMDEMESGALNGLSPNDLKKIEMEQMQIEINKEKNYKKQNNACLTKKEAQLFYKLYFALLDFTNQKYKIKDNYKIYKQFRINPYELTDIIDKFWEFKNGIIIEFCMVNPYKFNSEEIEIIKKFKDGFIDSFVIVEYHNEYTVIMNSEKVFMIKGLHANIDEVISYTQLPYMIKTAIMPFKGNIIYDGILVSYPVKFGLEFNRMVTNDYKKLMKYYHL